MKRPRRHRRGMPLLRAIDYLAQERQILATLAHIKQLAQSAR